MAVTPTLALVRSGEKWDAIWREIVFQTALIETAAGEFRAVWDSGDEKRHRRSIRFGKLTVKP